MRLFLAIELSEEVRAHLVKVQELLRPHAHAPAWTRERNLHLTLKFFGEVSDTDVPRLTSTLSLLSFSGSIQLQSTGLELFPPRGAIRIVAATLSGDASQLQALHGRIDEGCYSIGYPKEGRPYRPHVTLARARMPLPVPLRKRLDESSESAWPGPTFSATYLSLMESQLSRGGAEYFRLMKIPLDSSEVEQRRMK